MGSNVARAETGDTRRINRCPARNVSIADTNILIPPPLFAACDRAWLAATGLTVLADILLRKPLSVLAVATYYTIRDNVRVPETVYVGNGRSKRPIASI